MTTFDATYDPGDNKLRLRASSRLDPELYARVKAAGFAWAPRQELFVAPKWTPEREDLAIELAGELGDEDTSLVERAEERSERFEGYSERRGAEADRARAGVDSVSKRFEFGQPILVGHHSERRARKDAERIENGMRKTIKLWETSKYWTARAAGAIAHAKYKELPTVRARRIHTLEAESRSWERAADALAASLRFWERSDLTLDLAIAFAGDGRNVGISRCYTLAEYPRQPPASQYEGETSLWSALEGRVITVEQARDLVLASKALKRSAERYARWLAHLANRLAYERAMLAESGYVPPPKPKTKSDLPLLNYPGEVAYRNPYNREITKTTAHPMTKAELAKIPSDYKGTRMSEDGTHRLRYAMVGRGKAGFGADYGVIFLTDSKTHARPGSEEQEIAADMEAATQDAAMAAKMEQEQARQKRRDATAPARAAAAERDRPFEELKQAAKTGVKVVSAPQLFPTPPDLAERMVQEADLQAGHRVLEPSAGTGNLLRAIHDPTGATALEVVAVEINSNLAGALAPYLTRAVHAVDFLSLPVNDPELGEFDRIVMNPPFINASDIDHIRHAFQFLKPGGRLAGLCADGPKQNAILKPWVEELGGTWESLPPNSFASEGTSVRAALLVVDAPSADDVAQEVA